MVKKDIKIVFIDDDRDNCRAFEAFFRRYFKVICFDEPQEGIRFLENTPDISVVLCDQRMPEITGLEIMYWLAAQFPKIGRILVTGSLSKKAIQEALDKNIIDVFVPKPWDVRLFLDEINELLAQKRRQQS